MRFEFVTAARVIFGPGVVQELPELVRGYGPRVLVVTGRDGGRHASELDRLRDRGLEVETFAAGEEPTIQAAEQCTAWARQAGCDVVVGLGGGSALDLGKAAAGLLTNRGAVRDYLEVIGAGQPIKTRAAPYIAVPTTAGTGAEVTRNAVLYAEQERVKVSLRSPLLLPQVALVDPELSHTMSPAVTASTGLDALTQVIEPFLSTRAQPLTDALCRQAMSLAAQALPRAYRDGQDVAARRDMSLVSLYGGLGLANAGLGAVHGFAGPLGGMLRAPHGMICASLLPQVMATNLQALEQRASKSPFLARFREVAGLLTAEPEATAREGVRWVRALCAELRVPRLGELGLTADLIPEVVAKSRRASSMKPNPIELSERELTEILEQAL